MASSSPAWKSKSRTAVTGLGIAVLWLASSGICSAATMRLKTTTSRHYRLHHNLAPAEARGYAGHMDAVFEEYHRRFSHLHSAKGDDMSLYLFRTQPQFVRYLASHGIHAENTSGMFFVQPNFKGLATWTQDKSVTATVSVLQHEGFHQFAHRYYGSKLPVWINEGLAQYFEDGIFINGRMKLGIAHSRRIETVRQALRRGATIGFNELINMTYEEWKSRVISGDASASVLYAQSWSMVFFLIHGNKERYRVAFDTYLNTVATGTPSRNAFHSAFRINNTSSFEKRWKHFAHSIKPDALNTAMTRMEFLGEGLRMLQEKFQKHPRSTGALRRALQRVKFRTMRQAHGFKFEISAMDESVYKYQMVNGALEHFQLLKPSGRDLPSRIGARGLRPEPTLIWSRDADQKLVHAFLFRR